MSDGSPSNTASSAELFVRPPIKRARAQLSCTPCRQGKLKCNRDHPVCDQCTKRGRQETCLYVPPPPKNKQAHNMRGRIRNLENLVVTLINQKAQEQEGSTAGPNFASQSGPHISGEPKKPANEEPHIDSFGQLRISTAGSENYVGAGHWSNILKEIEEVKASLEEDDWTQEVQEEEWDHFNARSSVTFGVPKPASKAMLIQALHDVGKAEVDRLLPFWFSSADPLLFIIHAPTFLEEYKQFWKDPSATPVMWIAMLFSIMALGIIVGPRNPGMNIRTTKQGSHGTPYDDKDDLFRAVDRFQQLASSAIVLADMAKSQPYTIETLMIYSECEFLRRDDHHTKVWLMNGVIIRVAMKMGYHRDPSNFSGVTPFQGEMRRRAFNVLYMLDTLISFAIGLPTQLRSLESDVGPPRNLYDTDFSPSSKELPPERPYTEVTPALYSIAKARVCKVFAEAVEMAQKIIPPKPTQVMSLNTRLDEAHDAIPAGLRVRPMEDCIADSSVLIMSRFNIELLYQKTRIVLHRNYLIVGQTDARFSESRRICLEAARELLRYQNVIFHACQPGGQLNKVWWYMSSLSTYDFLLAAMVLCLELHHLEAKDSSSPEITEILAILENTHNIWANHHNRYRESVRGAEILKAMINKSSTKRHKSTTSQDSYWDGTPSSETKPRFEYTPESMPEELPPHLWGTWQASDSVPSSLEIPGVQGGIDWGVWDSSVQAQAHMAPTQPINAAMEDWMVMSSNVDSFLDGVHDFHDPLNIPNATGYVPPIEMNWSLQ